MHLKTWLSCGLVCEFSNLYEFPSIISSLDTPFSHKDEVTFIKEIENGGALAARFLCLPKVVSFLSCQQIKKLSTILFKTSTVFQKKVWKVDRQHSCKQLFLTKSKNAQGVTLGQKSAIYLRNHIWKISFFTKFTFWKYLFLTKVTIPKTHLSQNSQLQSLIFDKIHIFQSLICQSWFLLQCDIWRDFF